MHDTIFHTHTISDKTVSADLQYNPFTGVWSVSRSDDPKDKTSPVPIQDIADKLTTASI